MSKLAAIGDYFESKGFQGKELEKRLKKDKRYQKLLKQYRRKTKKFHNLATRKELEKYPLPVVEDFLILDLVKKLENKKLLKNDREIVELILSQLEYDWRKGLLSKLKKLAKKYRVK